MNIMKAKDYDGRDVAGWLMSEKLDGVRAWWTGERLLSKNDKEFFAPAWFIEELPKNVVLEGELFAGRGRFQQAVGTVRKKKPVDREWNDISFCVFDSPEHTGVVEDRIAYYKQATLGSKYAVAVCHFTCTDTLHMLEAYNLVVDAGGEGIILRRPGSFYCTGESDNILRHKPTNTYEATVVGHTEGEGRNTGRTGALVCEWRGKKFKVGIGLSDEVRDSPPLIGSIITFQCQGLSSYGIPRFPRYVVVRDYE